jgi:hypothetical protein
MPKRLSGLPAQAMASPDKQADYFLHPFSIRNAFGKFWKIQMEESWRCEKPENKKGYEGWYEQVPTVCGGFIGLFQDKLTVILQFYTPKQRITCRKLAEQFKDTPGVRLDDWFSGYETVLYFPMDLFGQVAEAVGARKKRQGRPLTDAQRIAFAEGRKKGMAALRLGWDSLLSDLPETTERTEQDELRKEVRE